jgi:hypothetical protein
MRLSRMTTRRIMVVAASVALAMSAARAARRCLYCLKTAEAFAYLKNNRPPPNCWGPSLSADEQRARDMDWTEGNAIMEAIYLRAAWRLWEPIPPSPIDPDPPPP